MGAGGRRCGLRVQFEAPSSHHRTDQEDCDAGQESNLGEAGGDHVEGSTEPAGLVGDPTDLAVDIYGEVLNGGTTGTHRGEGVLGVGRGYLEHSLGDQRVAPHSVDVGHDVTHLDVGGCHYLTDDDVAGAEGWLYALAPDNHRAVTATRQCEERHRGHDGKNGGGRHDDPSPSTGVPADDVARLDGMPRGGELRGGHHECIGFCVDVGPVVLVVGRAVNNVSS